MLKGHVFKKQAFGNQIFALFFDTFTEENCGIFGNYKEKMQVTCNGNILTVASGCVCVRGRLIEEDTSTDIAAGTDIAFCKLVIEVDLDKENTEESLMQVSYRIVKSTTNYPTLTQTDIVANNSGVYQFELAQFKTTAAGIVDLVDRRTYLDFKSIHAEQKKDYMAVLAQLEAKLESVEDGSAYLLKSLFDSTIAEIRTQIANTNTTITNVNTTLNTSMNTKQKKITYGTSAPTGGSNGDIYIQYF